MDAKVLAGNSAGIMWARLMVGVVGSGHGLRASGDRLLRVAAAGCAVQRQQSWASSAEVSGGCRSCGCGGSNVLLQNFSSKQPSRSLPTGKR